MRSISFALMPREIARIRTTPTFIFAGSEGLPQGSGRSHHRDI